MTRIVTGALLAVIALVVIVQGGLVYLLPLLGLAALGLKEFYRLTRAYRPFVAAGMAGVLAMLIAAWCGGAAGLLWGAVFGAALTGLLGIASGAKPGVTVRIAVTALGLLYVGLGFGALLLLRSIVMPAAPATSGYWIVLAVVFGTWAGDTMAYFAGRRFGAHLMAPSLSPKKTWEGFAGGALGTIVVVVFLGLYSPLGLVDSLALGAVIACVGPLGDLFESLVKRDAQIKDSGRGLPGHGGVLDRFDALLWTSVAAYFLLSVVFGL